VNPGIATQKGGDSLLGIGQVEVACTSIAWKTSRQGAPATFLELTYRFCMTFFVARLQPVVNTFVNKRLSNYDWSSELTIRTDGDIASRKIYKSLHAGPGPGLSKMKLKET